MYPFHWSEIFLYLLPLLAILLVNRYGRPYLTDGKHIKLAVVDVIHPILWLCFHFISTNTFYFSLVPALIFVIALYAIVRLFKQFRRQETVDWPSFWRNLSNIAFIFVFVVYYILVVYRIIQVVIS